LTPPRAVPQLRRAGPEDAPFLRRLHARVLEPEFAHLGLDPAALAQLLDMQYVAQDRAYRQAHPDADFDLVTLDGEPVGRLSVDRAGETVHVLDIALVPEHRARGIGTELLKRLIAGADRAGRLVTLSVVRTNPALALYRRLGFEPTGGDEVHLELERRPAGPRSTQPAPFS
jgi:ribosomal protein S18 acetylase RimI-like enzyme